ncbi:MAG: hypothetical protein QXD43_01450 [Candidatus Aenigmatarchaeota archaeon]
MSKFILWTDASSKEFSGGIVTATGYVIKYDNLPPRKGSNIHYGINNSKGEIQAGIESLISVKKYCKWLDLNPKDCKVLMKTDFDYLSNIISEDLTEKNDLEKMLHNVKNCFKEVKCEEIDRRVNIAHNVCCLRLRKETENNSYNGLIKYPNFFYKYPDLCIEKDNNKVTEEILKFLSSNYGEVEVLVDLPLMS